MSFTTRLLLRSPRIFSASYIISSSSPLRNQLTMATLQSPPFTQTVLKAMQSLYPLQLADRAWDNVGLLQDNLSSPSKTILLTNDLTPLVAHEAITHSASIIITYHPFIFRGLKSITLSDPHQSVILQLAQHNIAVYSPHTAIDAAPDGLNDWLADMASSVSPGTSSRSVAKPISGVLPQGFEGSGYGRVVTFDQEIHLNDLIKSYAKGLGGLRHVMVARPKDKPTVIKSVAVCAGSGADVLAGVDADLIVTGEMSHHAALGLTMRGKTVLMVFHSNSERQFLKDVLKPQLEEKLKEEDVKVLVSEVDADPFEIWDVKNLPSF
ncbi:putative NGG1-interacting factor 3 [Podospora fimiseda]|uniref:NGG1-interacting factor 3 n=1 Tax=Podospora fimiseda TaxID=252190 RepID=A0AAN7BZW9_9PEZI|nr:putative NGG1-interacting factor 3 [Podospora fimiseda]